MREYRFSQVTILLGALLLWSNQADGRGFGRVGGFSGGGFRTGGLSAGGFRAGGFSAGGIRTGGLSLGGYSGGLRAGEFRSGSVVGPAGGLYTGSRGFSSTTLPGGTLRSSHIGGTYSSPLGGIYTGGANRGIATTPNGGKLIYGYKGGAGTTAGGAKVGGVKGRSMYVGPEGGVVTKGGRAGGIYGPGGGFAGGVQKNALYRNPLATDLGLSHYSRTFAGAYGTRYVSRTAITTRGYAVRRGFVNYNYFSPAWYAARPVAWRPLRWRVPTVWAVCTWPVLYTWCSFPATPVYYDYGTTVIYQDNSVYVNGQPAGTEQQYYNQAVQIADTGKKADPPKQEEWQPLGVFGMVQGEEENANTIFQLAIDKNGIIRGNYYNALTDTTLPVYGAVDKKTQRAAWTIGDKKTPVYETGIANLTKDETTMLVHFGKEQTQQWLLVRLDDKKGATQSTE